MTDKVKYGLLKAVTAAETAMLSVNTALTAHAADDVEVLDIGDKTMGDIVGSIISFILDIARYVGVALLVFGLYQLYTSFKDENPDGKIKAVTFCMTAVGLITLKTVLKAVGVIA